MKEATMTLLDNLAVSERYERPAMNPLLIGIPNSVRSTTGERAAFITVTPEMAEIALIYFNPANRKYDPNYVRELVRARKEGRWTMNGEGLILDQDGNILSGQHRLGTIHQSGEPMEVLISYGIDREASLSTIDTNRRRGNGDILSIKGENNCHLMASTLSSLAAFLRGEFGWSRIGKTSEQQQEAILQAFPQVREAVRTYGFNKKTLMTGTFAATFGLLFTASDEAKGREFFRLICDGDNMEIGHPVLTLRDTLIQDRTCIRKASRNLLAAFIIKAWNAFYTNQPLPKLTHRMAGPAAEKFPTIAGLPVDFSSRVDI